MRGNQRTSGETSRMEGGKIFGSGSRAGIAITVLIRNPQKTGACELFYYDIGDYLNREEKLKIITDIGSIKGVQWSNISPNDSYDWINQRDPAFDKFLVLGDKGKNESKTVFNLYSSGLKSNRDPWVYNFSYQSVTTNMRSMIEFYNQQVEDYRIFKDRRSGRQKSSVEEFIDNDPTKISWTAEIKGDLEKLRHHQFNPSSLVKALYRPFHKQIYYFDKHFNNRLYQMPKIFPRENFENLAICVTGVGIVKDFSALISDIPADLCVQGAATAGQCFPLYTYEKQDNIGGLFEEMESNDYVRRDNIADTILRDFKETYDATITKEDIFYYVYGILHSPEYKQRFEADLRKMMPRIPLAQDFWAFSKAGRDLSYWHLNYESIEPYPLQEFSTRMVLNPQEDYRVQQMKFGKRGKEVDKSTIVYNSNITLTGIPLEAYDYMVCDRSAIGWIIERYQFTRDKDSQITNDPNDWSDDPQYIINLVKRIVRVSVETVKIVNALPALNERK